MPVATRRKPRISYAEVSFVDDVDLDAGEGSASGTATAGTSAEVEGGLAGQNGALQASTSTSVSTAAPVETIIDEEDDGDEFTLKRKRRKKAKRRKDSSRNETPIPQKPVFDHAKILALPLDLLCVILSHLHPSDLYTLSISSKQLSEFLHSRKSTAVWVAARKRLTVFAPKKFINRRDNYRMTGRPLETLTHYPFERRIAEPEDNSEDDDDRMMQIHEQEMDDEEDEANKLPLAVPDPPSGISEFSLARYLFGNTCGACGRSNRAQMPKIPELLARFCKACGSTYHEPLRNAQSEFEAKQTLKDYAQLGLHYEFLLTRMYWHPTLRSDEAGLGDALAPATRRIFTQCLDKEFILYKEKKALMSPADFDAWFQDQLMKIETRRAEIVKLTEYAWLSATFESYSSRISQNLYRRNQKRFKEGILARMQEETDYTTDDLEYVLDPMEVSVLRDYNQLWKTNPEDAWEKVKPAVMKLMTKFTAWTADNPILRWPEVTARIQRFIHFSLPAASDIDPVFADFIAPDAGFLAGVPKVLEILNHDFGSITKEERLALVQQELDESVDTIYAQFKSAILAMRRDLVRTWNTSVSTPADDVDEIYNSDLVKVLDMAEVFFKCKECQEGNMTWRKVPKHPCFMNDEGNANFHDARRSGGRKGRCKAVGWQPQHVAIDTNAAKLYQLLREVTEASQNALSRDLRPFPPTHPTVSISNYKFRCRRSNCYSAYSSLPLRAMLEHLAQHMDSHDVTLEQLENETRPTIVNANANNDPFYNPEMYGHYDDTDANTPSSYDSDGYF